MKRCLALLALASCTLCLAQPTAPVEESPGAAKSLGYASVSEALESLKSRPGVSVSVSKPDGWVIINESSPAFAVWSFTPVGHYAHPAVVRRVIQQKNGDLFVEMTALCQAEKEPCDRLIREFQQLNERMREQARARMQRGKAPQ